MYGASPYVIYYGDPLLSRVTTTQKVDTGYDQTVGEVIAAFGSERIRDVYPIDLNTDKLDDLLIHAQSDTLYLVKNYGGDHLFGDPQELLRIPDGVKRVYVGDVDGNTQDDILVWTNNHMLRAYSNTDGVIDRDGQLICLDIP